MHGLLVHVRLSGKAAKRPPAPCVAAIDNPDGATARLRPRVRCCGMSTALCDWALSDGSTCDAPLCDDHATEVGPDRHLCPKHLVAHRAAAQADQSR